MLFHGPSPVALPVPEGMVEESKAFLQKPFTPDALAHKVREVLDADLTHRGEP